ncbi:hypothetical protein D5086_022944, partial [Populus alba]
GDENCKGRWVAVVVHYGKEQDMEIEALEAMLMDDEFRVLSHGWLHPAPDSATGGYSSAAKGGVAGVVITLLTIVVYVFFQRRNCQVKVVGVSVVEMQERSVHAGKQVVRLRREREGQAPLILAEERRGERIAGETRAAPIPAPTPYKDVLVSQS